MAKEELLSLKRVEGFLLEGWFKSCPVVKKFFFFFFKGEGFWVQVSRKLVGWCGCGGCMLLLLVGSKWCLLASFSFRL